MPREAAFMAGIFVLAALLWVTEALPLFATALLVIGLQLVLLANPGGWAGFGFESGASPSYKAVIHGAADSVLLLFFGGFLLAEAAVKEGVDRSMSALLLRPFGQRPAALLAGIMLVTALFSMFMSNTATTAMMVTLVLPLLAQLPKGDPFRKGLMLAVPLAANIGGLGTPIGSPPNAVAVGYLQKAGQPIGFLSWMLVAVPVMLLMLGVVWFLLWRWFKPQQQELRIQLERTRVHGRGWFVVIVFTATVTLWLTDHWHGLPASVVALLPAILFTASGMLSRDELNRIEWNVLILIAGGISLGAGMTMTGLDAMIVKWLPVGPGQSVFILLALLVVATVLLSTFMSNTAASNLLLPIGVTAAVASGPAASTLEITLCIAFAASLAMALPISTPPNAIAYSRNEFTTRDLIKVGSLIGIIGMVVVLAGVGLLLRLWQLGP